MLLGDSEGNKYPPFVVFKAADAATQEQRNENNELRNGFGKRMWKEISEALSQHCLNLEVHRNKKGWWNERLMVKWLQYHFAHRNEKSLLLIDDFSGHWTPLVTKYAASINAVLMKVPPGYIILELIVQSLVFTDFLLQSTVKLLLGILELIVQSLGKAWESKVSEMKRAFEAKKCARQESEYERVKSDLDADSNQLEISLQAKVAEIKALKAQNLEQVNLLKSKSDQVQELLKKVEEREKKLADWNVKRKQLLGAMMGIKANIQQAV
jgi:hypothetical protein